VKLLIVGFGQPGHMGYYLASAATRLGLNYHEAMFAGVLKRLEDA
jgi:hypothetical protein